MEQQISNSRLMQPYSDPVFDPVSFQGAISEKLLLLSGAEPRKVGIARAIWEQTVMPQKWLAKRLGMRSAANVSQQLRRHRANAKGVDLPLSLRKWLSSVNN